jgi:hypothetical protein
MLTRHPQAGDGIVDNDGYHWVVDGIATFSDTGAFRGILYTNESGARVMLTPCEYRRETFMEYLTRPTGFGRTSWTAFAFIQTMCAALTIAGAVTWSDGGWVAVSMAVLVETVLVWQSHRNYTGKTR